MTSGKLVKINLPTEEALRLALRVKPTADMPRPGAQSMTAKPKKAAKPKKKKK